MSAIIEDAERERRDIANYLNCITSKNGYWGNRLELQSHFLHLQEREYLNDEALQSQHMCYYFSL